MVSTLLISFSLLIDLTYLSNLLRYKRFMTETFHDYNERSYKRRLISYFLLKENTRTRKKRPKKKIWNKEHDTKTTKKKKNKEKISSPLRIGNDMAPIGLHDIMHAMSLIDKSILHGRCIRVWSILISIFEIPAARLGFLFDYILYLFFSCFPPYLYLIQFWISDHRQRLGVNDESSCNCSNVLDGSRYPFHCRLAYSLFLFCLFPWFFIFRPSAILSKLQLQPGVNGTLSSRKQKKARKKARTLSLLSLFLELDFPIISIFLCAPPPYHHATLFSNFDLFNDPNMSIPALHYNAMHDDVIYWTWIRCAMIDWVNWLNWLMDSLNVNEWAPFVKRRDMKLWCCWSNVVLQASWIFELFYTLLFWFWFFFYCRCKRLTWSAFLDIYFIFFPSFLRTSNFEYYLFSSIWIESFSFCFFLNEPQLWWW